MHTIIILKNSSYPDPGNSGIRICEQVVNKHWRPDDHSHFFFLLARNKFAWCARPIPILLFSPVSVVINGFYPKTRTWEEKVMSTFSLNFPPWHYSYKHFLPTPCSVHRVAVPHVLRGFLQQYRVPKVQSPCSTENMAKLSATAA